MCHWNKDLLTYLLSTIPTKSYGNFFFQTIFHISVTYRNTIFAVKNETTGTFQFVDNNIVCVILTRYIPEPKWGNWFFMGIKFVFDRRSNIQYFIDHREIIHTLKRTGELDIRQFLLKLNERPQYHVLVNKDKWSLNPDQKSRRLFALDYLGTYHANRSTIF